MKLTNIVLPTLLILLLCFVTTVALRQSRMSNNVPPMPSEVGKHDKTRGIVMEVFTGTNKSISQVREQLKNGAAYLQSNKNITNVSLYVMVNSERAAQRVRSELQKVGNRAVNVIVAP